MPQMDSHKHTAPSKAVSILKQAYADRLSHDPGFSLRQLARDLGYRTPSMVSAIFSGRRRLKMDVAAKMAERLELDAPTRQTLSVLLMYENASCDAEKKYFEDEVSQKLKELPPRHIPVDRFRFMADWYHLAIFSALKLHPPVMQVTDLAKRFQGMVPRATLQLGLDRLMRLGLVKYTERHGYQPTTAELYVDSVQNGDQAIQQYHRDTLKIATQMIDRDPSERDLRSSCFAVKKQDIAQIKKLAKEFHQKLHLFAVDEDGDEVVVVNSQIYAVAKSKSE